MKKFISGLGLALYFLASTAAADDIEIYLNESEKGAPYDLLIANILANPLIAMAPDIIKVVDKNGWIILSGLLEKQRQSVLDAYLPLGVELAGQHQLGEWPTLVLKKR